MFVPRLDYRQMKRPISYKCVMKKSASSDYFLINFCLSILHKCTLLFTNGFTQTPKKRPMDTTLCGKLDLYGKNIWINIWRWWDQVLISHIGKSADRCFGNHSQSKRPKDMKFKMNMNMWLMKKHPASVAEG